MARYREGKIPKIRFSEQLNEALYRVGIGDNENTYTFFLNSVIDSVVICG